jgi:hypothetical protein
VEAHSEAWSLAPELRRFSEALEAQPGAVEGLCACVADLHPFDEGSTVGKKDPDPHQSENSVRISVADFHNFQKEEKIRILTFGTVSSWAVIRCQ